MLYNGEVMDMVKQSEIPLVFVVVIGSLSFISRSDG